MGRITEVTYNFEPNFFIIDNFYDDPLSVRDMALNCEYMPTKHDKTFMFGNAPWPGKVSKESYSPKNLDLEVSKLFNLQLRQSVGLNSGRFRISNRHDIANNLVHIDGSDYAGVLYLNENCTDIPGTVFYTHKQKQLGYGTKVIFEELIANNDINDMSKWDIDLMSRIVFNRLIIYPANKFHGIGPLFGETDHDARLVQLFFWDKL